MRKSFFAIVFLYSALWSSGQAGETQASSSRADATSHSPSKLMAPSAITDAGSRIRKEAIENSRVMDFAFHLADVSGPRLTGSPGFNRAANWAIQELKRMGLANARLEPWGEFGKGWQQEKCYVAMTAPYYQPLIAVPKAWTGSTPDNKPLSGELVILKVETEKDLDKYTGTLRGKIVLLWKQTELKPSFEPDAVRHSAEDLARLERERYAEPKNIDRQRNMQGDSAARANRMNQFSLQRKVNEMLLKEKAALVLDMNPRGTDGTIFVGSGGSYAKDAETGPAVVMLSSDDHLRLQRLLGAGTRVKIEAEVRTKFFTQDTKGYNVIAEIPGSDPALRDEIVMLGAHLDSWHGATGATDNASGCAVMMEVVRIMQAMDVKPRRTIRIALWGGEEQGLLGSRNYVKQHFGDPATMELKPAQQKVSAYYNLDNGTGRIRGIYLQGNKEVRELFSGWLSPFRDLDAGTVTIRNTGSTDHTPFDRVGIPGFQFIQDWVEYNTRTHHTNMDTYDHLVAEDLKQASIIVAAFVYNTAQRDEMLPRKDLPKAGEGGRGF